MKKSRVAVAALAIALMAPLGATALATPPDPLDSDNATAAAYYYSTSEGVSLPVANNIISDQESVLKAATSAGIAFNGKESVWFESDGNKQTVVIRSEDDTKIRAMLSTRTSDNTTIVAEQASDTANISLDVTDETVQEIKRSVPGAQGVYVRESDGALMIDAAAEDGPAARASVQAITISGYPTAIVTYGDSASDSLSVRGGTGMSSCTAGLPAKYGSYIGFVSAAHCPASTRLFGNTSGTGSSVAATQRRKVHNANADIAFYSVANSNTLTKTRFAASSSTAVNVGAPMNVGTGLVACHRGKTTGWQCGKITSIAYKPTYAGACPGTTCNSVFYRVGAKQAGGDSGGPWSFNSSYIGIHKGGSSTFSIFSAVSRVPSGVTVNH